MKNLIKNNIKQKIWLIGSLSLIFVLLRPMMQLLEYENTKRYSMTREDLVTSMEGFFLPNIFTDCLPTLFACAIIGLVFFSYLFSKKKVDLYHSIPVDRKHLFISNYVSGIITYAIALSVEYLFCIIIAVAGHYFTIISFKNMLMSIVCNLVHFLYGYGIVLCAVMLTGNIIVSMAAGAVFALFFPVIMTLFTYMERYFYVTYTNCDSVYPTLVTRYSCLSPVTSFITIVERSRYDWYPFFFKNISSAYASMILPLIIAVAVTTFAYWLYLKRPSEAAGRAIAFKASRPVIEVAISLTGGFIGVWFMSISVNSYKNAWIWFGAVLGVVLSHCVLEIIINESFKAFLSHKIQLLCTVAAIALIVGIYYGDFTKYDSYIPNRANVKTAGIYFDGIDNNLSYNDVVENPDKPGFYITSYHSGMDYTFTNRVTDEILIDRIFGVANIGTTCIKDMIEAKENNDGEYYYKEAVYEDAKYGNGVSELYEAGTEVFSDDDSYENALSWMEENGYHEINQDSERNINVYICYELNSGRIMFRQYTIPLSKVLSSITDIYNNEKYNRCHFDIYNGYENGVISKIEVYDNYETRVVSVIDKDKDRLLDTYISELKNITIDTISQAPIGRIVPSYKSSEFYDDSYSGYYLYPEFTKTLEIIKSMGADVSGLTLDVDASEIVTLNVNSYNLYCRNENDYAYVSDINYDKVNDSKFIKEIAPNLMIANNIWSNEILIDNATNGDRVGADFFVYVNSENGIQRSFTVRLKDGVLPEKIKKDIAVKFWKDSTF